MEVTREEAPNPCGLVRNGDGKCAPLSQAEPAAALGQRTLPFIRWPEGEGPGAPQEVWIGGVLASRRWFEAGAEIEERFFEGRLCQRKRRDLPPPPGLRWREVQELPPLVPSDPLHRFITAEDDRGKKTLVEEVDVSAPRRVAQGGWHHRAAARLRRLRGPVPLNRAAVTGLQRAPR